MSAKCNHADATKIGKIGKCSIWCGALSDLKMRTDLDLVISAIPAASLRANPFGLTAGVEKLIPVELFTHTPPEVVEIKWDDGGIPPLARQFWVNLVAYLKERKEPLNLGLCCMGGHGRTGVMAAILASLGGLVPKKKDPVKWLRKKYCNHVVETNCQLDYVENIAGVKVVAAPAYGSFGGLGSGTQSSFGYQHAANHGSAAMGPASNTGGQTSKVTSILAPTPAPRPWASPGAEGAAIIDGDTHYDAADHAALIKEAREAGEPLPLDAEDDEASDSGSAWWNSR